MDKLDPAAIINRLEIALNLKNDKALADYLNVGPSVVSNWKSRGISNFELIFTRCGHVDFNYLIKGAEPTHSSSDIENQLLRQTLKKLEQQNVEYWELIKKLTDR